MLNNILLVAVILPFISLGVCAQKTQITPLDSAAYSVRRIKIHDAKFIGGIKDDTFFLTSLKGRVILKNAGSYSTWRFEDFDGDGFKDILLVNSGNTPDLMDLYLYQTGTNRFVPVKDFSDFPAPERIKGTPYYYSYHHSGCADENWDSDLFYLRKFKAVRLGNIAGVACAGGEQKEGTIYINRIHGSSLIPIKKYPISVIEKYKEYKWGFIKQYWKRNYKLFQEKALLASKNHFITEKSAMDMVSRLPEMKEDNYYMRHSKSHRDLFPVIFRNPDSQQPYYLVAMGEDNGALFVPHYEFLVYVNGGKILYYDDFNDTAIDLRSWRRSLRKK